MTIGEPITIDMRALSFLGAFPGREYRLSDGDRGVRIQVVAIRLMGDDIIDAANAEGLRLSAMFDDAHPDFVLIEARDERAAIARFATALDAMGYHRLGPTGDAAPPVARWQDPDHPPPVDWDSLPDPMTDEDAARFLRRREKSTVQRARLNGELAFIPGRPPRITKADFLDYLERSKVTSNKAAERKQLAFEARMTAREKANADAREWALQMLNRPKRAPRGKSAKPTA